MAKKPVLVVMAAGMGSRYGGLKQIDPVGSKGEAILDYSIYDAHQAGFETVVIIIKEAIKNDFMETVGARLKNAPVEIRYAYQELERLPAGYAIPRAAPSPSVPVTLFCAPRKPSTALPSLSSMPTTTTASPLSRASTTSCPPMKIPMATAWWAMSSARPSPRTAPWPAASALRMHRAT